MTPLVIAGMIAAIAAEPQVVLVVLAYSYLMTGLVGYVVSRGRTAPVQSEIEKAGNAKSTVS